MSLVVEVDTPERGQRPIQSLVLGGFLALGLLVAGLTGCSRVAPVVKIGLVGPFEGRYRGIGYDVIYSARLAVREVNGAGGIGGYHLALVALDDGGDSEMARATAAALVIDPAVVVVVGHWLPETTAAARPVYEEAGLAFIAGGAPPLLAFDPTGLPLEFQLAYAGVTPFEEEAGPLAGPAYDAFQLVWRALEKAEKTDGTIDRMGVRLALDGLEYQGLTGKVYSP